MVKKAVILCGGLGTRFLPYTKSIPKEMIPILDKPILQILLEELKDAGIEKVLIILGRNKECIQNHFDRNIELEAALKNKADLYEKARGTENIVDISYKRCSEPKGTAYALNCAKDFVRNDTFLMLFGDELMKSEISVIKQLLRAYKKCKNNLISVQKVDKKEVHKYGIIQPLDLGGGLYKVIDFVEKPKESEAPSNISYLGAAVLKKEIFEEIQKIEPDKNGCYNLPDAFKELIKQDNMYACEITGERFDTGNKFGFVKANIAYGLADADINTQLKEYIISLLKDF